MAFTVVGSNVLIMLSYMAIGYVLVKTKMADTAHTKTLSSFLIYCLTPAIVISSFQGMEYDRQSAMKMVWFFLIGMATQLAFLAIMGIITRRRRSEGKVRIMTIGSFLGNVGFFGIPVASSLFPDQNIVPCYCVIFAASMNMIIFTAGEYMITQDRKYISVKKAFLNPNFFGMLVAVPLYLLKIRLPGGVGTVIDTLRLMSAPICMLILGLRLASMSLREVFSEPFAYLVSALKLVAFPLFIFLVMRFLPWFDDVFKTTLLVTAGTPCASMILALAEIHGCEQKAAAYSVLLSTILCVVTLPLLTQFLA